MTGFLEKISISNLEVWPIIEGGKGVGVSNGLTAGSFAAAGAVGTFSGANPHYINEEGIYEPVVYYTKTRRERHEELIEYSIKGGISQAKIAHKISGGKGRIHMNILWEMGGAAKVLEGILEGARGLIHGVTAGAGMPYKLAEISEKFSVYYYPIISSARAFRALWQRAYKNFPKFLGGVVYEDPWLAGGHNGLSSKEDPNSPENPQNRLKDLRNFMREVGLGETPIVMAGGVWHINEWSYMLDKSIYGPIAFQFGTRPILTVESPVSNAWKKKLMNINENDVALNRFSPTGFYSSALKNNFIQNLYARSNRQIPFSRLQTEIFCQPFIGNRTRGTPIYLSDDGINQANIWSSQGLDQFIKTPDNTIIFVDQAEKMQISTDQAECMGCLSHCNFSAWKDHGTFSTDRPKDPRSYCIQKTLQSVITEGDIDNELVFSGHNAFRFGSDSFYEGGKIPTISELVERIKLGL